MEELDPLVLMAIQLGTVLPEGMEAMAETTAIRVKAVARRQLDFKRRRQPRNHGREELAVQFGLFSNG